MSELRDLLRQHGNRLRAQIESFQFRLEPEEIGWLRHIELGVAQVQGLPGVKAMEVVHCGRSAAGVAFDLDPAAVGVVLLDPETAVQAGMPVRRSGRVLDVPVGPRVLGRVLDPLGRPLDDGRPLEAGERWPVEREAPPILARAPVTVPLLTGIKVIDALVPIGRGQRELILGDRQTGKTTLALDTLLNQHDQDVICIYCAIGQRAQTVARAIARLRERDAMKYCVVVNAGGETPAGLQYLAPYAATTIGEWFMAQGRDVLVIYDDLSRHADAYRALSLLLRRPPGREAYPGDVFYLHARLLERATHLKDGGSLTALPIAETQAQNLSAYIPTNLISITDGQLYLSPQKFQRGELPAVDVGRSVSRVGGKAQLPAYRAVVGELKLAYAQYEELETFARFGTRLDERTRLAIERGRRVRELLKQEEGDLLTPLEQLAVLLALNAGLFDDLPLEEARPAERRIRDAVQTEKETARRIETGEPLTEGLRQHLLQLAQQALAPLRSGSG
ncbi:F-type H+/Na+-transporting ATPase subunit alpha [Methylomarinovum caldicuralii]|uniref:ATP synthase subunit alpha n=1 Tax=Methylomarinovum caldicuralii TaxID=438856 RepID=A0AAU9BUH5_9GAMM|nr:F0F1 ATP synthase subunit alpha [Methylomarinovum caldicuralii]BCX82608.1 F-type H+/Na+-transporting ATPase subunit alpha [Methylomarinovum caldicuralii]